jgi:hypothetical protein
VWSYDFVFDWCASGQQLKCLTVTDEWTKEGLAIEVDGRIRRRRSCNFVAFTNLMRGLDDVARALSRPVREIVHDRQAQFERTLQQWHELFARPDIAHQEPLHWPGDPEPRHVGQVSGSAFIFRTEDQSPGLQLLMSSFGFSSAH